MLAWKMDAAQFNQFLQAMQRSGNKRKLPEFTSGDPLQWLEWRVTYNIRELNNWADNAVGVTQIKAAMGGFAAVTVQGLNHAKPDELLKLYEAKFVTAEWSVQAGQMFSSAKQQQNKSITAWHIRVCTLYRRSDVAANMETTRELSLLTALSSVSRIRRSWRRRWMYSRQIWRTPWLRQLWRLLRWPAWQNRPERSLRQGWTPWERRSTVCQRHPGEAADLARLRRGNIWSVSTVVNQVTSNEIALRRGRTSAARVRGTGTRRRDKEHLSMEGGSRPSTHWSTCCSRRTSRREMWEKPRRPLRRQKTREAGQPLPGRTWLPASTAWGAHPNIVITGH